MKRKARARTPARPTRPAPTPLPPEEWDFDGLADAPTTFPIPDEGVHAWRGPSECEDCCLWEYARECQSVWELIERYCSEYKRLKLCEDPDTQEPDDFLYDIYSEAFEAIPAPLRKACDSPTLSIRGLCAMACSWQEQGRMLLPHPWATISPRPRNLGFSGLTEVSPLRSTDALCALESAFDGDTEARLGPEITARLDETLGGSRALPFERPLSSPLNRSNGRTTAWWLVNNGVHFGSEQWVMQAHTGWGAHVLNINWAGASDRTLLAEFERWLKENRPADCPSRHRGGRSDFPAWADALDWLAHARALAHRRRTGASHPARLKIDQRERRKRRDRARAFFRRLFPCLPAGEKPLFDR